MSDALLDSPLPADADRNPAAAGVAGWLCDLLDMACDREDAPLARLIAGVMDDLGNTSRG